MGDFKDISTIPWDVPRKSSTICSSAAITYLFRSVSLDKLDSLCRNEDEDLARNEVRKSMSFNGL